jgi:hypothetical protein
MNKDQILYVFPKRKLLGGIDRTVTCLVFRRHPNPGLTIDTGNFLLLSLYAVARICLYLQDRRKSLF